MVICRMEASSVSPRPVGAVAVDRGAVAGPTANGHLEPGHAERNPVELGHVELPPERRLSSSALAVLAVASGVTAIVLGAWAFYSGVQSDSGGANADAPPPAHQQAITLLARGDVQRLPLRGSVGRLILVVDPAGDATLVLNGLSAADSRWAYQAWVFPPGITPTNAGTPRPAALFSGREALVPLTASVPPGASVAVTLEPAEGSFAPTRTPRLVVERPA
jgi:hypothetical protein